MPDVNSHLAELFESLRREQLLVDFAVRVEGPEDLPDAIPAIIEALRRRQCVHRPYAVHVDDMDMLRLRTRLHATLSPGLADTFRAGVVHTLVCLTRAYPELAEVFLSEARMLGLAIAADDEPTPPKPGPRSPGPKDKINEAFCAYIGPANLIAPDRLLNALENELVHTKGRGKSP